MCIYDALISSFKGTVRPGPTSGFDVETGVELSVDVSRTYDIKLPTPNFKCVKQGEKYDSDIFRIITAAGFSYTQR